MKIKVNPDSLAYSIYQKAEISETFTCNYELNLTFRKKLEEKGLKVSGEMEDGAVRIVELSDYPFFMGTGFVPQLSSEVNNPHPLVVAFLQAALK
jgi:CTP synthase (UTP-ammonia lyase)